MQQPLQVNLNINKQAGVVVLLLVQNPGQDHAGARCMAIAGKKYLAADRELNGSPISRIA